MSFSLNGPGLEPLPVTKEMYLAMQKMMHSQDKPNGTVTIQFNSGNIAGVVVETKQIFK